MARNQAKRAERRKDRCRVAPAHSYRLPGRPLATVMDVSISFSPILPLNVSPAELVAFEHLLGPALQDLLGRRDRDSLGDEKEEV